MLSSLNRRGSVTWTEYCPGVSSTAHNLSCDLGGLLFYYIAVFFITWRGRDILVYLCPLSLSAQCMSVRSIRLYVPFISVQRFLS